MVIINNRKKRGYRLVKERGIITVILPNVTYRMYCEKCGLYGKEHDPSAFADWSKTEDGALCPQCRGKVEVG